MKRYITLFLAALMLLTGCSTTTEIQKVPTAPEISDGHETSDTPDLPAVDDVSAVDGISAVDGVIVALIDTGISTAAIDEEHLLSGHNYVRDSEDTEDRINHGTAVASIIAGCESADVEGLAPDAFLVPLVVTDKVDGEIKSVSPDVLAQAIRDSIDIYGADIINVSLGIQKDTDALREAVEYAARNNVAVISAVGNGGKTGKPYYPAAYDAVLAVGSCDRDGNQSDFTQNGAEVLAPGEDIMLASRNGVPYGVKGTSFSTGFVSAYAAKLLSEDPSLPPRELYDKIAAERL